MSEETKAEEIRCEWCGWPFRPPKSTGRRPKYCRRSCRQRAYEARRVREEVDAVLAYRQARPDPSRDETVPTQGLPPVRPPAPSDSSRDGTEGGDFLLAPPDPASPVSSGLPDAWRAPAAPRRTLSRRRSGEVEAPPLPFDAEGE